jgi:phosphoribosyl-dephospho-CoA transferase
MALDFQQVREQIRQLGEGAPARARRLRQLREMAQNLLQERARELAALRRKVERVVEQYDPSLRCALPLSEPLDAHLPPPPLPEQATVLAADGSQIAPDRHAAVEYGLINVGAIQLCYDSAAPPVPVIYSHLFSEEELSTASGSISSATLALRRDLNERLILAQLAAKQSPPVITFTDGLMEIWGPREMDSETASEFQQSLAQYLEVLRQMSRLKVATAGYVDRPGSNLVVRLLEVALAPESELHGIKGAHPLRGLYDIDLYRERLGPGERSPIFEVQSPSTKVYTDELALHFFYLNVGRAGHPWLARVEFPAWVAGNQALLDPLHAILVHQCQVMGTRPYPYLLHRAHETAIVTLEEKEQVTQMIAAELLKRTGAVSVESSKQYAKDRPGRTRHT